MFHITIVNKDDGKVLIDYDTEAIVGGTSGETNNGIIACTWASIDRIAIACHNAIEAKDSLCERMPLLKLLLASIDDVKIREQCPNDFAEYEAEKNN